MIRVLHVYASDCDLQTSHSVRALQGAGGAEYGFEVVPRTIRRGADYADLFWAAVGMRRDVDRVDLVHAWDQRALAAAVLAGARRIVFTPPAVLKRRNMNWFRLLTRGRAVHFACATRRQQQFQMALDVPADHCHLIRPPLIDAATPLRARDEVRRQLGFRRDDFVLIAPGESTRPAAHERAVWAASLLHVVDERYRALLWGRGDRVDIAANLSSKLRQDGLVSVATRACGQPLTFEELLPAADAMVVTARGPVAHLPIAMGMKAGVPIVAAELPNLAELLIDERTAWTVPANTPRLLAQRVFDVRANPAMTQALIAQARAHAVEMFSPERFADQHGKLYRHVAGGGRLTLAEAAKVAGIPL